jgi:hypothetical protein
LMDAPNARSLNPSLGPERERRQPIGRRPAADETP